MCWRKNGLNTLWRQQMHDQDCPILCWRKNGLNTLWRQRMIRIVPSFGSICLWGNTKSGLSLPRRRHNLMWYASMLPGACIQEPKASFFNAVMRPSVAFWTKYFLVLFVEFILSASNWLLHVPGTHANHRDKQTAMPHPHQSHQSDVGWVCQFGWQQPNNLVGYWLLHYETGIGRACAHGVCSHSSVMVWSLVP